MQFRRELVSLVIFVKAFSGYASPILTDGPEGTNLVKRELHYSYGLSWCCWFGHCELAVVVRRHEFKF